MESRIALITDIHSNIEVLRTILIDIKRHNIQTIYSLGNIIGLGPHPKGCLKLLMNNNIISILGNAEYYITLGANNFEYLKKNNSERYDYSGVWKYNGTDVSPFFETNTDKDIRFIEPIAKLKTVANQDSLFNGKKINDFDIIIFGHYHFYREHELNGIDFYSLNGSGVGIDKQAIYYTLKIDNNDIKIKENKVDYDYEKVYDK